MSRFAQRFAPWSSTSTPVVKLVNEAFPHGVFLFAGCVVGDCSVQFHRLGASPDSTRHADVRSIVATAERYSSAAVPPSVTLAEFTQTPSGGPGSAADASVTPPEIRFARDNQRLYRSGHDGGKNPGRGKRGPGFGRGAKRKYSAAPVPAKGAVLGGWRTERRGEGKRARFW